MTIQYLLFWLGYIRCGPANVDSSAPNHSPNEEIWLAREMNDVYKEMLWQQFGAAIAMLNNAILACPDELWCENSRQPRFWYVAYHTLFWLDLYLSESAAVFVPPAPFTRDELDPRGIIPEKPYTKEQLQNYLTHCRNECRVKIAALSRESTLQRCGFERLNMSIAELMLYNLRHVQHHAAQLNLLARQNVDSAPRWVAQAKEQPES
jgi:hypothetical protein